MELKTEFLYRAHIDVEGFYEVGRDLPRQPQHRQGEGRLVRGSQGEGGHPAGHGRLVHRPPGRRGEGDVRDTYRTHDGHIIYVSYRGIIDMPPELGAPGPGRGRTLLRVLPARGADVRDGGGHSLQLAEQCRRVSVGKQEALGVTYDVYQDALSAGTSLKGGFRRPGR